MSGAKVELSGVQFGFSGAEPIFTNLDLKIAPGEFLTLLGPSGCGKSTLLRLIAGILQPKRGILNAVAADSDGKFFRSFVFQEAQLLPWRNSVRNVALPLELMGRPKAECLARSQEILANVGLKDATEKFPNQLSGGMKMRVSLARALVTGPSLLLMDEPFAALDEQTRFRLQDELLQMWSARKMTVVFVTHSVMEAAYLATRTIVLGKIPKGIVLDRRISRTGPPTRNGANYLAEVEHLSRAFREGEGA